MEIFNYFSEFYIGLRFGWNLIISNLIFTISIVLVLNDAPWTIKGIINKCIDLVITWCVEIVLFSGYYALFQLQYLDYIMWTVMIFLHMFLNNHFSWLDRIIRSLTLEMGLVLTLRIAGNIGYLIFNDVPALTCLWTLLFIAVYVFFLMYFPLSKFNQLTISMAVIQVVLFILVFAAIIVSDKFFPYDQDFSRLGLLILFSSMYIVCLFTYYFYYTITKEHEISLMRRSMLLKAENDLKSTKMTEQNLEDLRKMRHDMRNQYQYMKMLLKEKDYDKLDSFFSDIMESSFVPLSYVDCGNSIISGIMNMEINKAKEQNVEITRTLLVPKQLSASDVDLFSLFTNILDNALEAMAKGPVENKAIDVNIIYQEPYLSFKITNPIPKGSTPDQLLHQQTTKENKEIHGYGKKIILDVIQKYQGTLKNSVSDNLFICKGMIYSPEVKDHE